MYAAASGRLENLLLILGLSSPEAGRAVALEPTPFNTQVYKAEFTSLLKSCHANLKFGTDSVRIMSNMILHLSHLIGEGLMKSGNKKSCGELTVGLLSRCNKSMLQRARAILANKSNESVVDDEEEDDEKHTLSRRISASSESALSLLFAKIDVDGSGFLDIDEINQVFIGAGLPLSARHLKKVLTEMDTDGDERVAPDEFYAWMEGGSKNAKALRAKLVEQGEGCSPEEANDLTNAAEQEEKAARVTGKVRLKWL